MVSSRKITQPVRPVAPYIGGKRNLAATLVDRIEAIPHITYAEPFIGMGGVFLRRRSAPKVEVINDLSRDVANFFRILQQHYPQFLETLKWQVTIGARFDITRLTPMLEDVHQRLSNVVIECLPWEAFIPRYDRPETLFYLDPPYYGCESYYGPGFDRSQFEQLAQVLAGIKGRFLMCLNDTPVVRSIFDDLHIDTVDATYSVNSGAAKRVTEVIISNICP